MKYQVCNQCGSHLDYGETCDCMIRILDYCGCAGIDIEKVIEVKHEYNKTRPYRHGGKKC